MRVKTISPGAAIETRSLSVSVGPERVLSDVSFSIRAGEFVGIAGPNGGGKSTLLRAILGLIPASSGDVRLFGVPRSRFHDHHRLGYLPQSAAHVDASFPATAREIVAMGLVRRGFPGLRAWTSRKERAEAVAQAMRDVGVEHLAARRIGNLSGGERQRVLLAKALVGKPDLLILDEPTTGVDPSARDKFAHLLLELNAHRSLTILLVSHDPDMLNHVVDRILVINRRVVGDGPPDRLASSLHHEPKPGGA